MSDAHAPRSNDAEPVVLRPDSYVRDAATNERSTANDWIAARMRAESRTREECGDELVNAIARGDVVAEDERR